MNGIAIKINVYRIVKLIDLPLITLELRSAIYISMSNKESIREEIQPTREEIQYDMSFYHGSYPLWKFLDESFDIDIRSVCTRVAKEEPMLKCESGLLAVRVITDNQRRRLVSPLTHPESRQDVTFLLNCVYTVYNALRPIAKLNGELALSQYGFQLTDDCCLELIDLDTGERACELTLGVVQV
jgi:hypothetical protein